MRTILGRELGGGGEKRLVAFREWPKPPVPEPENVNVL